MNSIRPLITITVLVVGGVFLFTKINSGPADMPPRLDDAGHIAPPSVPPLSLDAPAASGDTMTPAPAWTIDTTANQGAAPAWPVSAADPPAEFAPPALDPPAGTAAHLPSVPAVPELPPLAATPPASAERPAAEAASPLPSSPPATSPSPVATSPAEPIGLPANIPMARYPGDATDANAAAVATPMTGSMAAAYADDRYGPIGGDDTADSSDSFAATWPVIQAALARQELAQAHAMLSQWYGSPSLSPTESQQVDTLLSQLAGTVVYSMDHRLEPPYVVRYGDTLETIAGHYDVPWQLLAKINGVPAADLVQPGQQLKVVHGPFSAVVDLARSEMTLLLGDRYAGRFPIMADPSGAANIEGEWVLEQKLAMPAANTGGITPTGYGAAPSKPSAGQVLVLRNESPTATSATISIAGGPISPSGPTAIAPAAVRLAPQDAEDVADILSVGSRVSIRR